jgi:hypothetical protein
MASDPPQDPQPEVVAAAEPEPAPLPPAPAEPVSPAKEWGVAIALMIVFGFMAFQLIEFLRHAND